MGILNYQEIKHVFNKKIFENSRRDLIEKLSRYPSRYVGLFRATKPYTKIIQNITQSHEIKFGNAFELLIRLCFERRGYQSLERKLKLKDGSTVNFDQLFSIGNCTVFIEQKLRDDHDSTKKRGQVQNFEKKLNHLIDYGYADIRSYIYFVDDSLNKNQKYYLQEIEKLRDFYGVSVDLCYGQELFQKEMLPNVWQQDIISFLKRWRNDLPDLPEINFDKNSLETFNEIKELPLSVFRGILDNEEIVEIIFPIIFPTKHTLRHLLSFFRSKFEKREKKANLYYKLAKKLEALLN